MEGQVTFPGAFSAGSTMTTIVILLTESVAFAVGNTS